MLKTGQIVQFKNFHEDSSIYDDYLYWKLKITEVRKETYMVKRIDVFDCYPVEVNKRDFHQLIKWNVNYLPDWF